MNQLRKLDDEDWQVFNNELLTQLSEERMDTHTTPAQRMSRPRIYKDQVLHAALVSRDLPRQCFAESVEW